MPRSYPTLTLDDAVDEVDERCAVCDVAGAIDQRVLPSDQITRHERAEIACVRRPRSRTSGGSLDDVRTNTVTSCPAASA
jgi:hypothetical protein